MPVYNRAAQVEAAARGILDGAFQDFELIAVDDGSTDDSVAVLTRLSEADGRVRVLRQANAGAYAARNAGAAVATGRYLAMQDADDVSLPDRLARQVELLDAHADVALVGSGLLMVDAGGERIVRTATVLTDDAALRSAMETYNPVHTTTAMIRKASFDAVGGFRRAFRVAGDYDLWLRLSERWQIANIADPLAKYRIHGDQISTTKLGQQVMGMLASQAAARWRKAHPDTPTDPLDAADAVTPELLAEMGVDQATVDGLEIVGCLAWAELVTDAGHPDMALALLDRATQLTNTATTSRSTLAKIHHGYARAYSAQHQTLRTLASAARAKLLERDWSPPGLVRRVARKFARPRPAAATDPPAEGAA
jgi:glycosyltransferase involved in cell wall biosynthesis